MTNTYPLNQPLWTPGAKRVAEAQLTAYMKWLKDRGHFFDSFASLWQWSIDDQQGFWGSLWDYFAVIASGPYKEVLASSAMPGARWFTGAALNYAEHVLRHERDGATALRYMNERNDLSELSWAELAGSVRRLATRMRQLGVKRGSRVVAYLPNSPEAVIAMLATTSMGGRPQTRLISLDA